MTLQIIERFAAARPFRAFTIRESSGVEHRVVSPETVRVLPKLNTVVVFPPDGSLVLLGDDQLTAAFYSAAGPGKKKPSK